MRSNSIVWGSQCSQLQMSDERHTAADPTQPLDWAAGPVPSRIGPYRILEQIGEGGMGEVYLAEQEAPLHRRVALKIVRWGMDTKEVVARFEAERQALAMMSHPNIAQVFDAGATESGRPYFVMEHVPGEPITNYCDRHRLATGDRLSLFLPVCQAIQHAHEKGIIHRDIKPSNVLVTAQDRTAIPKVIDFGVAKAINQRLTEHTIFTEQGRMIGTPVYMSPEQAEMTGLNVDTTTDVYSLGALLYELLTGLPPFDAQALRASGLDAIHRIIRETDPPTPSARISQTPGQTVENLARHHNTPVHDLRRQLRGDLDWITMRAMEKDRLRRYSCPRDLADDIERHLRDEPVHARGPSLLYGIGKFLRRRRVVALLAAVALTLVVGTVLLESRNDGGLGTYALSGAILSADGEAIPGARITVDGYPFETRASSDGRFYDELPSVRPGDRVRVRVSHPRYRTHTRIVAVHPDSLDLTIRLRELP